MLQGFAPVCNKNAQTLILGSMPGTASLQQQQYYAHPRNLFWPFVTEILGLEQNLDYLQRCELLKAHGFALWDVLKHCERAGSLDSAIKKDNLIVNDFDEFFTEHQLIERVFFNGKAAEQLFRKHVPAHLNKKHQLRLTGLPSTSPANAAVTRADKLKRWRQIKV